MKKIFKLFTFVIFASLLFGCSKEENTRRYANIENGSTALVEGLHKDAGTVSYEGFYNTIRDADKKVVYNKVIETIAKKEIDFTLQGNQDWYKNEINRLMMEKYVDTKEFFKNDKFEEEFLVQHLKAKLYDVSCETGSGNLLDPNYFTCDYSNYIEASLRYEAYENMLIQKYIVDKKANLINRFEFRNVSYYKVKKDTENGNFVTLDYMSNLLDELSAGTNTLMDAANALKASKLEKIDEEYNGIIYPTSNYYSLLEKYTTCGNVKCFPEEGLIYKKDLIEKEEYYATKLINNKNKGDIFPDNINERLFSTDIESKLVKINGINYLTSTADYYKANYNNIDALLFDNNNSEFYLIQVQVVNSQSSYMSKVDASRQIMKEVSKDEAISNYLNKYDLEIYEDDLKEYLTETFKKFKYKD